MNAPRNTQDVSNGSKNAYDMQRLGFRDYLAARCLFLNNHLLAAATMSSLAVERYLKVPLIMNGPIEGGFHLHELKNLENRFKAQGLDLSRHIDYDYLHFLGKAFQLRYHDRLAKTKVYSVHMWQALTLLDETIGRIDGSMKFTIDRNGQSKPTDYQIAASRKDLRLIEENFIFQGKRKESQMGKIGPMAIIYVSPKRTEVTMENFEVGPSAYSGKILRVIETLFEGKKMTIKFSENASCSNATKSGDLKGRVLD